VGIQKHKKTCKNRSTVKRSGVFSGAGSMRTSQWPEYNPINLHSV